VGAFFAHRVTEEFVSSPVGKSIGASSQAAARAIGGGAINTTNTTPGPLHQHVLAAEHAFTTGFHSAMTLCAVFALAAAGIAFLMLRTKNLHSSALSLVPPEDLDHELAQLSESSHTVTRP
jgi:hypothetical protein